MLDAVAGEDDAAASVHAHRDRDDRRALGEPQPLGDIVRNVSDRNGLVELRDRHPVERRVPLELGMGKLLGQARHGRRSLRWLPPGSSPDGRRDSKVAPEVPGAGLEPARPLRGHPLLRRARLTRSATPAGTSLRPTTCPDGAGSDRIARARGTGASGRTSRPPLRRSSCTSRGTRSWSRRRRPRRRARSCRRVDGSGAMIVPGLVRLVERPQLLDGRVGNVLAVEDVDAAVLEVVDDPRELERRRCRCRRSPGSRSAARSSAGRCSTSATSRRRRDRVDACGARSDLQRAAGRPRARSAARDVGLSAAADHPERDSDDPESKRNRSGGTENCERSRATAAVVGSSSCALFGRLDSRLVGHAAGEGSTRLVQPRLCKKRRPPAGLP